MKPLVGGSGMIVGALLLLALWPAAALAQDQCAAGQPPRIDGQIEALVDQLGARRIGIDAITTPIASPRANAVIERLIGTLRRECLDHFIILDEQHLRSVVTEFVQYYNLDRPHRTLRLETPVPVQRTVEGPVQSQPVLGGLHHVYKRVA